MASGVGAATAVLFVMHVRGLDMEARLEKG